MNTSTVQQLDTYLARVVERANELRQLNLTAEHGTRQALEESQRLLATLAMYRHQLKHAAVR